MKKAGIIGGMGTETTVSYYRLLLSKYQDRKQDGSFPEILLYSIDFKYIVDLVKSNNLDKLVEFLSEKINLLYGAGADFGIIAANAPHIVFDQVNATSPIPLLSIVEETCKKTKEWGIKKAVLLGARPDFYRKVFDLEGIEIVTPIKGEIVKINNWIFNELTNGVVKEETKNELLEIIRRIKNEQGIEGMILGCTELTTLLKNDEDGIKLVNTLEIHVESVVDYMTE